MYTIFKANGLCSVFSNYHRSFDDINNKFLIGAIMSWVNVEDKPCATSIRKSTL